MAMKKGIYRHYKGNLYEVIGFANHSETLEKMVIYKALYDKGEVWVRPIGMWDEIVLCNGNSVPRFEYIEDKITIESSCGAVCYRLDANGKIEYLILHQYKSGIWSFPKGHIEQGETIIDGAKREIFEETGIKADVNIDFTRKLTYTLRNGNVKQLTLFLAEIKENPIIDGREISEFKWAGLDEAVNLLPDVGYGEVVADAEMYIRKNIKKG